MFDKRGTGLSDREVGFPTLEQRTDDIRAVMDAAGSEKATLFGVSEGGNMSALFAATYPERTQAVILYGSGAKGSWAPDYPWRMNEEEIEDYLAEMERNWGLPFDLRDAAPSVPRSPGHVFYDRLQSVLVEGGFDAFAEASCRPYYAARMGAPSVPPGRYFRMHLVGYFEGIDSERGLEWRCSDSLSLRAFLRLGSRDRVPDHSWLSRSRTRLPHEVHAAVFDWVLVLIAEAGLIKGERIGVDASCTRPMASI